MESIGNHRLIAKWTSFVLSAFSPFLFDLTVFLLPKFIIGSVNFQFLHLFLSKIKDTCGLYWPVEGISADNFITSSK